MHDADVGRDALFDTIDWTDATPLRPGESRFEFLNRSASNFVRPIRELLQEWLDHVPADARPDLVGALRGDDRQHESAFWELYLHEGFRRSGYEIELHPEIPGIASRPDFRMSDGTTRFYLEAVSVGETPRAIGEERRLQEVDRVLDELVIENFTLSMEHSEIGPRSPATRKLRSDLIAWTQGLDPDAVARGVTVTDLAFDSLPAFPWCHDGWRLAFRAIPYAPAARGTPHRAVGVKGPAEAVMVDNVTPIRRVLDKKYGRYGELDAPLVIAVQSNTKIPTHDYQVKHALYGLTPLAPTDPNLKPSDFFDDGFWLTRAGWRRSNCPQVITIYELSPLTVISVAPRAWSTLEPGVRPVALPGWIRPMIMGKDAQPGEGLDVATHFGVDADGLAADPDFHSS